MGVRHVAVGVSVYVALGGAGSAADAAAAAAARWRLIKQHIASGPVCSHAGVNDAAVAGGCRCR